MSDLINGWCRHNVPLTSCPDCWGSPASRHQSQRVRVAAGVEAEAIARLRKLVETADEGDWGLINGVDTDDLRALLDAHAALETAHTEALDALQHASHCGECAIDSWNCCEVGRLGEAVLAKAGRR